MRTRNLVVSAAVAAGALFTASVPAASATMHTLTLETAKGPLATGAEVVLSSANMRLESASGNDECTTNLLTGTVTTNGAKTAVLTFSSTSFSGGSGIETTCSDTDPLGPVEMTGIGLPWTLTLYAAKGTGKMKGAKKVGLTENHVESGPHATCVFEAGKILSTFTPTGTTAEPFALQISNQAMKRNPKAGSGICPGTGELSGSFTATSEGEEVLAHT